MPVDTPIDKGCHDESGHKEGLVDQWIHDGSHERSLVEMPSDPAVEAVENGSRGVNGDGRPAKGFVRGSGID